MFGPMGAQSPCHYSSCDIFVHITVVLYLPYFTMYFMLKNAQKWYSSFWEETQHEIVNKVFYIL